MNNKSVFILKQSPNKWNIFLTNAFIFYCILFHGLSIFGLMVLFLIDIAVAAIFVLAKAENAQIDEAINNDLKYAGHLSYWDERRYRGNAEFTYMILNLIVLGLLFIFILSIPFFIFSSADTGDPSPVLIQLFQSKWFWICGFSNAIWHAGVQYYYLKSKAIQLIRFEDLLRFDYFKYWLFIVLIICGGVLSAFLITVNAYTDLIGSAIFGIIYIALRTMSDKRDYEKHYPVDTPVI